MSATTGSIGGVGFFGNGDSLAGNGYVLSDERKLAVVWT